MLVPLHIQRVWYGVDPSGAGGPGGEGGARLNWPAFWTVLRGTYTAPSLVWNPTTLQELCNCLQEAERNLDLRRQLTFRNLKFSGASPVMPGAAPPGPASSQKQADARKSTSVLVIETARASRAVVTPDPVPDRWMWESFEVRFHVNTP